MDVISIAGFPRLDDAVSGQLGHQVVWRIMHGPVVVMLARHRGDITSDQVMLDNEQRPRGIFSCASVTISHVLAAVTPRLGAHGSRLAH